MIGSAIKSHPFWNRPSGAPNLPVKVSITENELIVTCRPRNTMRNAPLTACMNFFPIEELNMNIFLFLMLCFEYANIMMILQV